MSMGSQIKKLREKRGLTQSQLADAIGVSDKAVSTWENDQRVPRMVAIKKLAEFFNVENSVIVDEKPISETTVLSANAVKRTFAERLKAYREAKNITIEELSTATNISQRELKFCESNLSSLKMSDIEKVASVLGVPVDILTGKPQGIDELPNTYPLSESTVAMIPIIASVKAGWNGVIEPVYDGYMAVYDRPNKEEYRWYRVKGDSMNPVLQNGDLALVHIQPFADNGEMVVAVLGDEEGTVKIFQQSEYGIMLTPVNSTKYPSVLISNSKLDQFRILGVVVESKRVFK